jgi:hypothetical protein
MGIVFVSHSCRIRPPGETMKKTRTLTAIGASLAIVGGLIALPSASMAATTTINFDCVNPLYAKDYYVIPGNDVTIVSETCDYMEKNGVNVGSSVTIESSELSTETRVQVSFFYEEFSDNSFYFYLADPDVTVLTPLELARTETMTIPATGPSWFSVGREEDVGEEAHALDGNDDCELMSGDHPYTQISLDIASSGDFTFRVSGTSPRTEQNVQALELDSLAYGIDNTPIADPFLAVYTSFDPENPDDNVVGCNDDRPNYAYLNSGIVFSELWPQFDASLEPGTYTLVMTTYEDAVSADWTTWSNSTAQTASMELWGTAGAITPTSPTVEPGLAATGVSSSGLPVALSIAALGLLLLTAASAVRRRRSRA